MILNNSGAVVNVNGQMLYITYQKFFDDRPTLVFLHDSLGCISLWRDFPLKLSELSRCNMLVYDRLGYGKSAAMPIGNRTKDYLELEADVLNKLLEKQQLKNVILFGHSDGGSIALITASKYPHRISGVICEAGHVFVEQITINGIKQAVDLYKNSNLAERLKKHHGSKENALFKAWTETWLQDEFNSWNIEVFLPGISVPLLFIQGKEDEYGSLEQVDKTISQVKGIAEKLIIENVGHTPHKEAAEKVLIASHKFIERYVQA